LKAETLPRNKKVNCVEPGQRAKWTRPEMHNTAEGKYFSSLRIRQSAGVMVAENSAPLLQKLHIEVF